MTKYDEPCFMNLVLFVVPNYFSVENAFSRNDTVCVVHN